MLGERSLVVTTYPGVYVNGVWVQGPAASTVIQGSVQPLAGDELERLPEGLRHRATLKLYTTSRLALDDEVTVDGQTYVVHAASEFSAARLGHGKYTLVLRGADE